MSITSGDLSPRRSKKPWATQKPNWGKIGKLIVEDPELTRDLCDAIISELPAEAPLFTIEGEVLRHDVLMERLTAELEKKSIKAWITKPA